MTDFIRPMLAQATTSAGNRRPVSLVDLARRNEVAVAKGRRPEWVAEVKHDGIRAMLSTEGPRVRIWNRNGVDITERFPELTRTKLMPGLMLDGEIVARDGRFQTVATRDKQTRGFRAAAKRNPCMFVAFDLLRADGQLLLDTTFLTRRICLEGVLGRTRNVRPVRQSRDLIGLWHEVVGGGGEGLIVKQSSSVYLPGKRAASWLKFKAMQSITALAVGYEATTNRVFGAVHLALVDGKNVVDVGRVGTGWDVKLEKELRSRLDAGEVFPVEVHALNRTEANALRFPVLKGVRDDVPIEAASADQLAALPVY